MKKTYLSPATDILRLHTVCHLMEGSTPAGTTIYTDTDADTSQDPLARRHNRNVWDDEDDDLNEDF